MTLKMYYVCCINDYIMNEPKGQISYIKDKYYWFIKRSKKYNYRYTNFDETQVLHFLDKKDFKKYFKVLNKTEISI